MSARGPFVLQTAVDVDEYRYRGFITALLCPMESDRTAVTNRRVNAVN